MVVEVLPFVRNGLMIDRHSLIGLSERDGIVDYLLIGSIMMVLIALKTVVGLHAKNSKEIEEIKPLS